MMDITDKHCPDCGYTEEDANIHLDHHLCINKNPPWEIKEKARADERARFIEQACEAVDAKKKKTIPGRVSISMFDDAYNDGLDAAEQAIRDRFKGEK